jgi:hypothetical protein
MNITSGDTAFCVTNPNFLQKIQDHVRIVRGATLRVAAKKKPPCSTIRNPQSTIRNGGLPRWELVQQ